MDVYSTDDYAYSADYVYDGAYDVYGANYDTPPLVAEEGWIEADYEHREINIEDEYYDPDADYVEEENAGVWLPYTPPAPASVGGGGPQQQVVFAGIPGMGLGGIYPASDQLSQSYCVLHAVECRKREGFLTSNATDTDHLVDNTAKVALGGGEVLEKVDLSGLGLVLLIGLLLLVGVHFGWDSEKTAGSGDRAGRPKGVAEERVDKGKRPEGGAEPGDSTRSRRDRGSQGEASGANESSGRERKNHRSENEQQAVSSNGEGPKSSRSRPDTANTERTRPATDTKATSANPTEPPANETPEQRKVREAKLALEKAKSDHKKAQKTGDEAAQRAADEKVARAQERYDRARKAEKASREAVTTDGAGESGNGARTEAKAAEDAAKVRAEEKAVKNATREAQRATDAANAATVAANGANGGKTPKSGAVGEGTTSTDRRTARQQAADAGVKRAKDELEAAKKTENEVKQKARLDERKRTGKTPSSTPQTPEVVAAKAKTAEAERKLEDAKREQAKANAEAAGAQPGGKAKMDAVTAPNEPAPARMTERDEKAAVRAAEREAAKERKQEIEAAKNTPGSSGNPLGAATSGSGTQTAADDRVKQAEARVKRRKAALEAAKRTGDPEKIAKAEKEYAQSKEDLAKAKGTNTIPNVAAVTTPAVLPTATAPSKSTPPQAPSTAKPPKSDAVAATPNPDAPKTENQVKADDKVKAAEDRLVRKKAALRAAQASGDPEKIAKAQKEYQQAKKDLEKAKAGQTTADAVADVGKAKADVAVAQANEAAAPIGKRTQAKDERKAAEQQLDAAKANEQAAVAAERGVKKEKTDRQKKADADVEKRKKNVKTAQTAAQNAHASGNKNEAAAADDALKDANRKLDRAKREKAEADAEAAGEAPPPTPVGGLTDAQKTADRKIASAKKAIANAKREYEAAKAAGDEAGKAAARAKVAKAQKQLKAAEEEKINADAEANKSAGVSGTASTREKADAKVENAQAELDAAREAEEVAKATGDPARIAAAKDARRKVEKDVANAKEEADGSGTSLTPWKLLPIVLIIPLLGLIGRARLRMPVAPGPPIRKGVFTPPSSFASRPVGPSRSWTASSKPPAININNINAQGSDIPINTEASSRATFVEPVVETKPVIEIASEPLEIRLSGPANPDRLVRMVVALMVAAAPLFVDYARDWPIREYTPTDYLAPIYHWIVLFLFLVFALYAADRQFGLSRSYGGSVVASLHGLGSLITPAVVATVEGSDTLVWGLEDMVLGDGKHLFGMVLAVGLLGLVSMREPLKKGIKTEYAPPAIQFLYLFGVGVVGMLFWNA